MKVQNYRDVKGYDAAPGAVMHIVAGVDEGAPNFVMRVFEIQPGGSTPNHAHPWEHEMFVVSGEGTLISGDSRTPLKQGDAVMVLPDENHCFANTGNSLMTVICIVPLVSGVMPGMPSVK